MELSDAELQRRDAADRREVDPPIEVDTAMWSAGGTLDWWVNNGSGLLIFVLQGVSGRDSSLSFVIRRTTLRISVDDMTHRDLFQFADLARASHIDPSTKVDWVLPFGLQGELELEGDYRPPLTLDGEEARDLVEALDLVAESDGDVRQMMSVLAEWRDRLRDRLLQ